MAYTGQFQVFEDIIKEIMVVYKHDSRPWLIGYSGGKDSTLLTCLVYEAMKRLKDAGSPLEKTVHVITSDTMVENPIQVDIFFIAIPDAFRTDLFPTVQNLHRSKVLLPPTQ